MNGAATSKTPGLIRCAIYTRKSSEEGLEQEFNSLDAQRESGELYVSSQRSEGWVCLPDRYDDGGYTGGNMERPALTRLIDDIERGDEHTDPLAGSEHALTCEAADRFSHRGSPHTQLWAEGVLARQFRTEWPLAGAHALQDHVRGLLGQGGARDLGHESPPVYLSEKSCTVYPMTARLLLRRRSRI